MAKSKGKRKRRNDSLVLQLMILVAVVLVVFARPPAERSPPVRKIKEPQQTAQRQKYNRIKIWHWRRQQTEMAIFLFWQGFRRERER